MSLLPLHPKVALQAHRYVQPNQHSSLQIGFSSALFNDDSESIQYNLNTLLDVAIYS